MTQKSLQAKHSLKEDKTFNSITTVIPNTQSKIIRHVKKQENVIRKKKKLNRKTQK